VEAKAHLDEIDSPCQAKDDSINDTVKKYIFEIFVDCM
jgi:hypothetical protein